MALGHLVALVNIKIAGKWVFTPLTLIIIGFDTHTQMGKSNTSSTRMMDASTLLVHPSNPHGGLIDQLLFLFDLVAWT